MPKLLLGALVSVLLTVTSCAVLRPNEPPKPTAVVAPPPVPLKIPVCVELPATPKPAPAPCRLPPAPEAPTVDWAPKGCEVRKFGACLSVKDMASIIQYRQEVATWMQEATSQCKAIK